MYNLISIYIPVTSRYTNPEQAQAMRTDLVSFATTLDTEHQYALQGLITTLVNIQAVTFWQVDTACDQHELKVTIHRAGQNNFREFSLLCSNEERYTQELHTRRCMLTIDEFVRYALRECKIEEPDFIKGIKPKTESQNPQQSILTAYNISSKRSLMRLGLAGLTAVAAASYYMSNKMR